MEHQVADTSDSVLNCIVCGYDLRTQPHNANCPECGTPVRQSLIARTGITKRELTLLVLRVMAIWFVLSAIPQVFGALIFIALQPASTQDWMLWTLPAVFMATLAVVLWWSASLILRFLVPHDGPVFGTAELSAQSMAAVALLILGVYFTAVGIIGILPTVAIMLMRTGADVEARVISHLATTASGLVLILGRNGLARLLLWARTAATKSAAPGSADSSVDGR